MSVEVYRSKSHGLATFRSSRLIILTYIYRRQPEYFDCLYEDAISLPPEGQILLKLIRLQVYIVRGPA